MTAAVRVFFIVLLILAYAEGRWLSREVTIVCAFIAWLGVYYAGQDVGNGPTPL